MSENENSTTPSWSDEQLVNAGQMAAEALGNPIFQVIHQLIEQRNYVKWRKLPEAHTKEAAAVKARMLAMDEIYQEMVNLRQRAINIIQERQEANSPARKEAQHLDEQGFGLNFETN